MQLKTDKTDWPFQYAFSLILILIISTISFFTVDLIGYRVVALILLLAVSILAILFDILPVLSAAILSALIWNFFFIPPLFTFHINTAEDLLMFAMYFAIALINAVLTSKIRQMEMKAKKKEEQERTILLYDSILNSLSHELRTPISTIIGAIDTVKGNETKLSQNNRTELYSEIETAALRLNKQVENLLSMSRLESGMLKPNLDWCDVNEMLHNIVNSMADIGDRRIQIEAEENLPLFRTDSALLEQICYNIIHNAVRHTPENTLIEIHVGSTNNGMIITIRDNGLGFQGREPEAAFEKFHRFGKGVTGGTGLGLSIAKGFTEVLNGRITLEHPGTGGVQFTLNIPADTSPINPEQ